jgi:hypothetical protein
MTPNVTPRLAEEQRKTGLFRFETDYGSGAEKPVVHSLRETDCSAAVVALARPDSDNFGSILEGKFDLEARNGVHRRQAQPGLSRLCPTGNCLTPFENSCEGVPDAVDRNFCQARQMPSSPARTRFVVACRAGDARRYEFVDRARRSRQVGTRAGENAHHRSPLCRGDVHWSRIVGNEHVRALQDDGELFEGRLAGHVQDEIVAHPCGLDDPGCQVPFAGRSHDHHRTWKTAGDFGEFFRRPALGFPPRAWVDRQNGAWYIPQPIGKPGALCCGRRDHRHARMDRHSECFGHAPIPLVRGGAMAGVGKNAVVGQAGPFTGRLETDADSSPRGQRHHGRPQQPLQVEDQVEATLFEKTQKAKRIAPASPAMKGNDFGQIGVSRENVRQRATNDPRNRRRWETLSQHPQYGKHLYDIPQSAGFDDADPLRVEVLKIGAGNSKGHWAGIIRLCHNFGQGRFLATRILQAE